MENAPHNIRGKRSSLIRAAAAGSALLFLGVLVLWITSYLRVDDFVYVTPGGKFEWELYLSAGRVSVKCSIEDMDGIWVDESSHRVLHWDSFAEQWNSWSYANYGHRAFGSGHGENYRFLGLEYNKISPDPTSHEFEVPYSYFTLLTAVIPTLWLLTTNRRRRRDRLARGLCPTCGFDLRASQDRCPECGTPMPTPSSQSATSSVIPAG